jgi:glycosyltransferase involved in cell wall biosynthesis
MSPENKSIVTVVIATYNRAATLKYALESVAWQTFKNFEVWVVGDCCTDHTEKVVAPFLEDPRFHWYNMPQNSGYQSRPNNEGIRRAKGKYIAYLNHDDVWLPNHLQDTVSCIEKSGADIVFSIIQWVYSFTYSRPDIPLLPDMPIPPEATAVVHKKDIVKVIGYWKDIHETYSFPRVDFLRQAQFKGLRFEIVPSLTGLKFLWQQKNYHDVGPQPLYMERLRNEPDFINKELSAMLIRMEGKLHALPEKKRMLQILYNPLRRWMLRMNIDPAALKFWRKKGNQIKTWRKLHGLKDLTSRGQASKEESSRATTLHAKQNRITKKKEAKTTLQH